MAQLLLTASDTPANTLSLSAVTDAYTATDADNNADADVDNAAITNADIATEKVEAADAHHEMQSQIIKGYSQDPWLQATWPCSSNIRACTTGVMRLLCQIS